MDTYPQKSENLPLSQLTLDSLIDGILIVSDRGEWLDSNAPAVQICQQLNPENTSKKLVPQQVWRICRTLIDGRESHSNQPVVIEDEILNGKSAALRVRAQWITLDAFQESCMVVMLEKRGQPVEAMAIAEARQYHLTPREAEVWSLYRTNHSYREIAAKLFISLNTVKKHMKNVHAKRQLILAEETGH